LSDLTAGPLGNALLKEINDASPPEVVKLATELVRETP